jgi:uncharacterized protein YjgD (DUF1641 family)
MQAELELEQLNQKLDALTEQVAFLAAQARAAQQEREMRDDLLDTINPVAKEALNLATEAWADLPAGMSLPDVLRLLGKLLRHAPQLESLLDAADSAADLVETVQPLTFEVVAKLTSLAGSLEEKGYFRLAESGARTLDALVPQMNPQTLENLPQEAAALAADLNQMVRPGDLQTLRRAALAARAELDQPIDASLGGLLRQMRDPAVRRGLALTLALLRGIGKVE